MNTTIVAKSVGGTAVVLTGSGYGGYVIYDRYTTTIRDTLADRLNFLDTSNTTDDSKWEKLVESYKNSTKKFQSNLSTEDKDSLKNRCKELLDRIIGFEDITLIQEQVERWCTEIQDIKNALKREGKDFITGNQDAFRPLFTTKTSDAEFKKFLEKENQDLSESTDLAIHKTKCDTFLNKVSTTSDFQTDLEKVRNYCVKLGDS